MALALVVSTAAAAAAAPATFSEPTHELGIDFVHWNGRTGAFYMPETVGGGAALLDYDNDGDLDVYLVQGALLGPGKTLDDALDPPPEQALVDRLYRNDLAVRPDGSRRLRFTDVTESSGLRSAGYGMGATAADYDGDGFVDLYVTRFGANQLWRNNGDGTFRDVTATSGTAEKRWSVSAAFADYDRDGRLDLYVANYTRFTFELHKVCRSVGGAQDYCGPMAYADERDRLLRNRGDGTFEDVTRASGVHAAFGAGLGVVDGDFNGDGWTDFYVANDEGANLLWINRRNGKFTDEALLSGCAVNAEGRPEASMGVAAGDFDGDGDEDLFLTHLTGETHTLYVNGGPLGGDRGGKHRSTLFDDATRAVGLGPPSFPATGFGTGWIDVDNDGWLDLLAVNGAVRTKELVASQDPKPETSRADHYPFDQPNQLFRNLGGRRFEDATARAGAALELSEVSRGAAFGDVDNDGDTDVVIANNNGPARLLINELGQSSHWLGVRVVEGSPQRDALGARVTLERPGLSALVRRVRSAGSYASGNDPRVIFGLGSKAEAGRLTVRWVDGTTETWSGLAVDEYTTLVRGSGSPPP